MANEVMIIDPKTYGLEEKQATEIQSGLTTILKERDILKEAYTDTMALALTVENAPTFKALRLQIVKNRTQGLNVWHKTNKAYFIAGGNFVQAIYNKEVAENERMEAQLMEAEKHFENLELERIAKLQKSRAIELESYDFTPVPGNIGEMEESVYKNFVSGVKLGFDAKKKAEEEAEKERKELEAKAEAERLAKIEQEKKERQELEAKEKAQRIENEQLRKEKEDQEKAEAKAILSRKNKAIDYLVSVGFELDPRGDYHHDAGVAQQKDFTDLKTDRELDSFIASVDASIERYKAEAEAKAKAEKLAKEEEIRKAEQKKKDDEAAKLLADERAKALKLQEEIKAKAEAEAKAKADKLAADKAAAQAPDKDKLVKLINELSIEDPKLTTTEAKAAYNVIMAKFNGFKTWATQQVDSIN